jgi:hypothetical protein
MSDEYFPLLDAEDDHPGVPWPCLAAFTPRIWENHRLTATSLAVRGVTVMEALAIIEDRPLRMMPLAEARKKLDDWISVWRAGRCRVSWGRLHGRYEGISDDKGLGSASASRPRASSGARPKGRNVGSKARPRPSGW